MDGFGYVSGFLLPLVCWLYGLPLRPVFYALILMGSVLLLFIALDFWRFAGRIRNLEAKKAQAPFEAWDYPAHGPEEMLFAEIIEKIKSDYQNMEQRQKREKAAAAQYYALWSHQAKTPLAAIQLLLQEEHPDRNALEQSVFQAQQYVDMALQYQRLNDSANDLLLRRCVLEEIVKQVVKEVSILFIHNSVLNSTSLKDQAGSGQPARRGPDRFQMAAIRHQPAFNQCSEIYVIRQRVCLV